MPEVNDIKNAEFAFIYTDIGRGHPNYLDGIIERLQNDYPSIRYYRTNVFEISKGWSLCGWRLVRWMYRFGARGGLITSIYGMARRFSGGGEGAGLFLYRLGRDTRKLVERYDNPVVVAHPILAKMLLKKRPAIYQHGELACPVEAVIKGNHKILVPLDDVAAKFERAGIDSGNLLVTGQCIESGLVGRAESVFEKRLERLKGNKPLTAALFSSGAYPAAHLKKLRCAARSLLQAGHNVIFFAGLSSRIARKFGDYFNRVGFPAGERVDNDMQLRIMSSENRQEENQKVTALFDSFDFFIAPAHERTNWSVGLGLPQFILCPHIGSYAPLNAAIALERGVAREIPDMSVAMGFAETLNTMKENGKLADMARRGFGHTRIDGFFGCVKVLLDMHEQSG
jgi:hypothetical protein